MRKNLGILLLSAALALAGSEYVLRHYISPVAVYGPWFAPSQNVKGFEWQFLNSNSPDQDLLKGFHPIYGWDSGPSGIRETPAPSTTTSSVPKIVFVGDSFIFGNEVQADQTMASRIQELIPNARAINMGVPAFDIGQSYLKMVERGLKEQPDIIVFGIHPPNYERTTLNFFHRPKPIFELKQNGDLAFTPPLAHSSSDALYNAIEENRRFDLFTMGAMFNLMYLAKSKVTNADIQEYFEAFDPIIEGILSTAKEKAEQAGALFIIVQIPHGNRFRSEADYQSYTGNYPLNTKLIDLYKKLRINYVDLEAEYLDRWSLTEIFENFYTHPGETNSAGHFSVDGNLVAAEIIAEKLRDLSDAKF